MLFREATVKDIEGIMFVRMSVNENMLNTPGLVTEKDCEEFLTKRGKGWVCEIENKVVGFSIADLKEHNIWALFVLPEYEGKGIGKKLQQLMLKWYFDQTKQTVWLGTSPNTRAEMFYKKSGWNAAGIVNKNEIKFEMTFKNWMKTESEA
jgi:GNAT superfamily N-acetyltransferase